MKKITRKQVIQELKVRKRLAKKELAKVRYKDYVEYVHNGLYKGARHTDYICEKLEEVESGKCKRLIINLPPRHSKSMTVSETFPSFFIGKSPDRRVIEVSYGDSLARKFGRANKHKIVEYGRELFGVSISRDNASVTNWSLDGYKGGMISSGIGGGITGEGADLLIIDDPIKNRKESNSEIYREMIWNEWQNTLLTRLSPNGAVILIQTRWHQDDLTGKLLEQEGDKWDVISLPAIAEEKDLLGREIGEPLWVEYGFDEVWAESIKDSVGSDTWNSLYQQRPTSAKGDIFKRKWWNYYQDLPSKFDIVIQSWDCTFKDTEGTDYVVGQVWGMLGSEKFLIDEIRGRMDLPTTMNSIKQLTALYPDAKAKLIEDKANGSALIQMLKKQISGMIPINPKGSKEMRSHAVTPTIEAGNVYLPDPKIKSWIGDYVEELSSFPKGKYDDRVDATTQALNYLIKMENKLYKVRPQFDDLTKSSIWDL